MTMTLRTEIEVRNRVELNIGCKLHVVGGLSSRIVENFLLKIHAAYIQEKRVVGI